MTFAVEQQATSGMRDLVWLRVAGPFDTRREAECVLSRREVRIAAPLRVVAIAA